MTPQGEYSLCLMAEPSVTRRHSQGSRGSHRLLVADLAAVSRGVPLGPAAVMCRREHVLLDSVNAFKSRPAMSRGAPPSVQIVGEPGTGEGVTRE
jgi:hypothetical protein